MSRPTALPGRSRWHDGAGRTQLLHWRRPDDRVNGRRSLVHAAGQRVLYGWLGPAYWRSPAGVRAAVRPILRGRVGRTAASAAGVGPAVAVDLAAFHDRAVPRISADWLYLNPTVDWRRRRDEIERGRFTVGPGLPPVDVRPPLDWNCDPHRDRYWRIALSAWRMIDPYLIAADNGEPESLARILSYVADWHRQHLVEGVHGPFTWYDMAVGIRAQFLAYLVARARRDPGVLAAEQVTLLVDTATAHLERLLIPGAIGPGNHGLLQIHGLRALQAALQGLVDVVARGGRPSSCGSDSASSSPPMDCTWSTARPITC
jgi:hypothetical protein